MFPLRDDIPSIRVPVVNYILIGLCVLGFLAEMFSPDGGEEIIRRYGMIPARVVRNEAGPLIAVMPVPMQDQRGNIVLVKKEQTLPPLSIPPWMTLFTCMFLHGSLMHIVGNLWFLWIFGDNVEDRFGHLVYLVMYLVSGLAAGVLQIAAGPSSVIPTVGASGAIAGVMGAYFFLFPHARVLTLVPLGFFLTTFVVPAPLFLGFWFLFQIGSAAFSPAGMAGVAWWAHVGGFHSGLGMAYWGRTSGWLAPPRRYAEEIWENRFR